MKYMIRMRNLREDNDLTQKEVAALLGTSQTMYARYERGANVLPIRHLIPLAKYYNVTTDYLLGLTDQKTRASRHRDGKKARFPSLLRSPNKCIKTIDIFILKYY